MSFLIAFLALSFLVFFHELGHFIAARIFGVRVEVFSIGFGVKIFSKKIGETQYALSMIPLGGYVKLKGQNDLDVLEQNCQNDSYSNKSPFVKIIILFAGPFFNFILAFFLFFMVGNMGVSTYLPIVGEVKKNMPAFEAGILENDEILSINAKQIKTWMDLQEAVAKDTMLNLVVLRKDKILDFTIRPEIIKAKNIFGEEIQKGVIGIAPSGKIGIVKYTGFESFEYASKKLYESSKIILLSVQKLISGIIPLKEVSGPVMIVDKLAQASKSDVVLLLLWVGLISVNLGILNLLPIPALDGGQILFNFYEILTRKPIYEKAKYYLTLFGWIILLSLMLLGLRNDILRLLGVW